MISTKKIKGILLNQHLVEGLFIVEIDVKQGNSILVLIDNNQGISINDCKKISRLIENSFDREEDDFNLQVSSPGLSQPFKVLEQYYKNIGRQVEINKKNGQKIKGELIKVDDKFIEIKYMEKVKVESKKKKQAILNEVKIDLNEIKSTKIVISFK